jgi:hypothetical protein
MNIHAKSPFWLSFEMNPVNPIKAYGLKAFYGRRVALPMSARKKPLRKKGL